MAGTRLEVFALGALRCEEKLLNLMRADLLELVPQMHLLGQLSNRSIKRATQII